MLLSEEYRQLLRDTHAEAPWGTKGFHAVDSFIQFSDGLQCKTIIDYGSGRESVRRRLEEERPDLTVVCYDPGVEGREALPEPADFVVCTDVLEHVEEECIDDVLRHICSLARNGAYLLIALRPAKRILPDGRNAHLIVQPVVWWMTKLNQLNRATLTVVRSQIDAKALRVWLKRL